MSDYTCHGEDKEDLSDQVRQKVRNLGRDIVVAVRGIGRKREDKPWEIIVECSHGHRNKFSGKGQP